MKPGIIWRYGITAWGADLTNHDQHIAKHWMGVDGASDAPRALAEAIEEWLKNDFEQRWRSAELG